MSTSRFLLAAVAAVSLSAGRTSAQLRPASLEDQTFGRWWGTEVVGWNYRHWNKYVAAEGSTTVRSMAILGLSRFPENASKASRVLARRLKDEQVSWVRLEVIDGLAECAAHDPADRFADDTLLACFNDPAESQACRNACMTALVALNDKRMLPTLYAFLNGSDEEKVDYAIRWLPTVHDDGTGEVVARYFHRCLASKDDVKTQAAITLLGRLMYTPMQRELMLLMQANRLTHKYWPALVPAIDVLQPGGQDSTT